MLWGKQCDCEPLHEGHTRLRLLCERSSRGFNFARMVPMRRGLFLVRVYVPRFVWPWCSDVSAGFDASSTISPEQTSYRPNNARLSRAGTAAEHLRDEVLSCIAKLAAARTYARQRCTTPLQGWHNGQSAGCPSTYGAALRHRHHPVCHPPGGVPLAPLYVGHAPHLHFSG